MMRKRDSNWTHNEITTLLDSIKEITTRQDGRKINSKDVFDYAAQQMGEKGYAHRAERDKCRTKWKKMKEEFARAKRFREGDTRWKEAPGILPFFQRMEEFTNGSFDTISPNSTITKKTTAFRSRAPNGSNRTTARVAASSSSTTPPATVLRNDRTSCTNNNLHSSNSPIQTRSGSFNRQNSITLRHSASTTSYTHVSNQQQRTPAVQNNQQQSVNHLGYDDTAQPQEIDSSDGGQIGDVNTQTNGVEHQTSNDTTGDSMSNDVYNSANSDSHELNKNTATAVSCDEQADISYRVSSGCRQITIFGDLDVDIKFRRDCVTINKICGEYSAPEVLK